LEHLNPVDVVPFNVQLDIRFRPAANRISVIFLTSKSIKKFPNLIEKCSKMQITEHEEQTYIASYTGNVMFAVLFFNICCYKLRLSWQNKLRRKLIKIIFSFTLIITLYPHGMRPVRFLSASV